jgi:hypothetical protein
VNKEAEAGEMVVKPKPKPEREGKKDHRGEPKARLSAGNRLDTFFWPEENV